MCRNVSPLYAKKTICRGSRIMSIPVVLGQFGALVVKNVTKNRSLFTEFFVCDNFNNTLFNAN